jgi:hypothetical protein
MGIFEQAVQNCVRLKSQNLEFQESELVEEFYHVC